jgi:hypothetical protein
MKNPETEAISGFCCKLHLLSAEKEGFEPPEPWLQFNGFQDRRIRPLCHFSNPVTFLPLLYFKPPDRGVYPTSAG